MRRQGGGFGFVMLLVVLALVFYAAMRNLKSVSPAALEIQKHNAERRHQQETGLVPPDEQKPASTSASADTWNPSPPARPNLSNMDAATSKHSDAVKDSLSQAN